ncbi:MAG: PA domain-containing protein [Brumimicrobium sp.]
MKLLALTLFLLLNHSLFGQAIFNVVSPTNISGLYDFDPTSPVWGADINTISITGNAVFVDDGTAGDSLGCNALVNSGDVAGNIAIVYRGSCEFGTKALYAENAGAIGVVIVNNQPGGPIGMGAGTDGPAVTIPVVSVSSSTGQSIKDEIEQAITVTIFMGNKFGYYNDDVGITSATINRARSFAMPTFVANDGNNFEITPSANVINYGSNNQTDVVLTAQILRDGNVIYTQSSAPQTINSSDTTYITLPVFSQATYDSGYYDIAYNVSMPTTDEFSNDNQDTSHFYVNDKYYSKSFFDENGDPVSIETYRPLNANSFSACITIEEQAADSLPLYKVGFSGANPNYDLTGEPVYIDVWEWNDNFTGKDNATYNNLNLLSSDNYNYTGDFQNQFVEAEINGGQGHYLNNNQKYLVCVSSFNSDYYIGYTEDDYTISSSEEDEWYMPISVDGTWYSAGFGLHLTPSIYLDMEMPCYVSADFSYTDTLICDQESVISPTISGNSGGIFSSQAGLTLDPTTGEVDPQSSAVGNYTVEYNVDINGCAGSETFDLEIIDLENADFSYPSSDLCILDNLVTPTVTGLSGGTFSADSGIDLLSTNTGEINPSNSTLGTHTVYYTTSSSLCANTDSLELNIIEQKDASFTYSTNSLCINHDTISAQITGDSGGVFSSNTGLVMNPNSGLILPGSSTAGTYTIGYTVGVSQCQDIETFTMTIDECADISENSIHLIEVYPNPAQETINIDFPKTLGEVEITLMETTGKIVYSNKIKQNNSIDVQNYESGIYLMRFRTKQEQTIKRIVIAN